MTILLRPRVAIPIDSSALAESCVGAIRFGLAAAIVLGVLRVGRAFEAWNAARRSLPPLASALLVGSGARRCGIVIHTLRVVLILRDAIKTRRAACEVMISCVPRPWRLMMIVATALSIHRVEAQLLGLALAVVGVHNLALVVDWAAGVAAPRRAATLAPLLVCAGGCRCRKCCNQGSNHHSHHRGSERERARRRERVACVTPNFRYFPSHFKINLGPNLLI